MIVLINFVCSTEYFCNARVGELSNIFVHGETFWPYGVYQPAWFCYPHSDQSECDQSHILSSFKTDKHILKTFTHVINNRSAGLVIMFGNGEISA